MLGRDEHAIRDEPDVWYHRGHSRYGGTMRGRLILTDKRFIFIQQEIVERGGLLSKKKELRNVGVKLNLPVSSFIGAITESRERKKDTIDAPPSMFSKEKYHVIIVSLDAPEGQENPAFEVKDPEGWNTAIQKIIGGEIV
jgi:hypothetical protein